MLELQVLKGQRTQILQTLALLPISYATTCFPRSQAKVEPVADPLAWPEPWETDPVSLLPNAGQAPAVLWGIRFSW